MVIYSFLVAPLDYISTKYTKWIILLLVGWIYYKLNDPTERRRLAREERDHETITGDSALPGGEKERLLQNASAEIRLGHRKNAFAKVRRARPTNLSIVNEETLAAIAREEEAEKARDE